MTQMQVPILLDLNQIQTLDAIAKKKSITRSAVVRRAIDDYFASEIELFRKTEGAK